MTEEIKEILKDNDELLVVYNDNSTRTFDTLTIDVLDYITNLQQENEILKELNICVGCENNPDYKSRCEKAIEYIKAVGVLPKQIDSFVLLNILIGSDEND